MDLTAKPTITSAQSTEPQQTSPAPGVGRPEEGALVKLTSQEPPLGSVDAKEWAAWLRETKTHFRAYQDVTSPAGKGYQHLYSDEALPILQTAEVIDALAENFRDQNSHDQIKFDAGSLLGRATSEYGQKVLTELLVSSCDDILVGKIDYDITQQGLMNGIRRQGASSPGRVGALLSLWSEAELSGNEVLLYEVSEALAAVSAVAQAHASESANLDADWKPGISFASAPRTFDALLNESADGLEVSKGRIKILFGGTKVECGILVMTASSGEQSVLFVRDQSSYGTSPINSVESLMISVAQSGIVDPSKTSWFLTAAPFIYGQADHEITQFDYPEFISVPKEDSALIKGVLREMYRVPRTALPPIDEKEKNSPL